MTKRYSVQRHIGIAFWLGLIVGCHQDPVLPSSAIPDACRIEQIVTINEGVRDTTRYRYDSFGHLLSCTYRKWTVGQLVSSIEQTFSYSDDHYLIGQTNREVNLITDGSKAEKKVGYTYEYEGNPKLIRRVLVVDNITGKTVGQNEYVYEGSAVKSYTEKNSTGAIIKRYIFDGNGKLIEFIQPASRDVITVVNGKFTKIFINDSTTINNEFDARGQLIKQDIRYGRIRSVNAFTYDNKPHWSITQLRFRGIPVLDLGEHSPITNRLSYVYQRYVYDKLVAEAKNQYTHAYNANGYSLGYGRSDGERQVNYYTSSP